jgi:hypothetical protein
MGSPDGRNWGLEPRPRESYRLPSLEKPGGFSLLLCEFWEAEGKPGKLMNHININLAVIFEDYVTVPVL